MAVNHSVERTRALRRLVWGLWLLVALLAIAAAVLYLALRNGSSGTSDAVPASDAPAATWAAGEKLAPAFTLRDEHGQTLSLASLRGRPVLVTFIDPLCRDYCPTEAKRLVDVARSLPASERPAIVAVSVNVWGNAPSVLRQDRDTWNLTSDWHWAVGRAAELEPVWKAYNIQVIAQTQKITGVTVHKIGHTEAAYLIDANGHQRAVFLWPYTSAGVERALRGLTAS